MNFQISWHENKRVYLSVRKEKGCTHLRLHKLFQKVPPHVFKALIEYALNGNREAGAVVRRAAHDYFATAQLAAKPLNPMGKTYNLQEIFDRLNQTLQIPETAIGWSKRLVKGRRSITFGVYEKQTRQIRINPLLDDPKIPLYFVEFIVYHEMLHAICPTEMDEGGRCKIHTAEFKRRERLFPYYTEAKRWGKKMFLKG